MAKISMAISSLNQQRGFEFVYHVASFQELPLNGRIII